MFGVGFQGIILSCSKSGQLFSVHFVTHEVFSCVQPSWSILLVAGLDGLLRIVASLCKNLGDLVEKLGSLEATFVQNYDPVI